MNFKLESQFQPSGDQPQAIQELTNGLNRGDFAQTLLGVTGSGKTFTIANVIQNINRPTLILSHNKTLAAQLYSEFKQFFPNNAVEYFVSYYDYYQPEAYLPTTNTYIEKDLSINEEIEKLRLQATSALLSGRRDIIVVSSVSCIYGIGNPEEFSKNVVDLKVGMIIDRNVLLRKLVTSLYSRTETELNSGQFRVKGDTVDIYPAYGDVAYRLIFWDNEIESIQAIHPTESVVLEKMEAVTIYPANIFVTSQDVINQAILDIHMDLGLQIDYLKSIGKHLEAKRLEERTIYDIEMMKELGYCSGIENYSRYFDKRSPGTRPFCLMDCFPKDFLLVIDESHVTIPQIGGMYNGDRARKTNLVDFGFRLPAALDNRPLKFEEFELLINQVIYVSATPANFELERSNGIVVEQLVRPTGLLDPIIEVRPSENQIDDLLNEIEKLTQKKEKVLITTLTKRMAEELATYLIRIGIRTQYIHSDIETLDRIEILEDLRHDAIDVLVGVNLLREGLDMPNVSLVAILDADKEGFLRSERALTQTAGRAARNANGKVIFYADKITPSMQGTIDETNRRRKKQKAYNEAHGIIPKTIVKSDEHVSLSPKKYQNQHLEIVQEPSLKYMNKTQLKQELNEQKQLLEKLVKDFDFLGAAKIRDKILEIQSLLKE